MRILSNEELTVRLESLEQAFLASTKRAVDNTYTAESANNKADAITPYTETKSAGIQDTVCVFDGHYQQGVISAMVVTDRGTLVPNTIERSDDNITVRFDELTETATVTIQIQ